MLTQTWLPLKPDSLWRSEPHLPSRRDCQGRGSGIPPPAAPHTAPGTPACPPAHALEVLTFKRQTITSGSFLNIIHHFCHTIPGVKPSKTPG